MGGIIWDRTRTLKRACSPRSSKPKCKSVVENHQFRFLDRLKPIGTGFQLAVIC